jgi:hypothetical protein
LILALPPGGKGRRVFQCFECDGPDPLKTTPAKALGVADLAWSIGQLIDAALATQPITPVPLRQIGGAPSE